MFYQSGVLLGLRLITTPFPCPGAWIRLTPNPPFTHLTEPLRATDGTPRRLDDVVDVVDVVEFRRLAASCRKTSAEVFRAPVTLIHPQMGKSKKKKKKKHANDRKPASQASHPSLAESADKFDCYQQSVQTPEHEVEFFEQAYREAYGEKPITLREDFCGTFAVCCHWVQSAPERTAVGVDLCRETLAWGREHNLAALDPAAQRRVKLIEQDVRKRNRPQVDVLAAQNFSFWLFKTRAEVITYFKAARANLQRDGVMVIDMMGGGDCYTEGQVDKRVIKKGRKGFRYEWKQASFNPITAEACFEISFKFQDGSKLNRAFEYDWRFWTIPEVREMLGEAGFREHHVYWDLSDDDDDESRWERCETAPSDPSWICYIVALK